MGKNSVKKAFSLIELSVVIIIIGLLVTGIVSGRRLINQSKLTSAQSLTKSSPVNSIPDLVFWFEPSLNGNITNANSSTQLSNGDLIASLSDISASKITLSQSSSSRRPSYLANGINGLPSLSFDGADDVLYSTTAPISKGNSNYTIIAVWQQRRVTGGPILVEQKAAGTAFSNLGAAIWLDGTNFKFSAFNNDSSTLGSLSVNKNCIGIIAINNNASGNVSGYLNTNTKTQVSTTSPSAMNLGSDLFSIGGRVSTSTPTYDSGSFSQVYISEVIVFNRALKQLEIESINSYLSQKYKITIS